MQFFTHPYFCSFRDMNLIFSERACLWYCNNMTLTLYMSKRFENTIMGIMFSFISFRRNINYLLPRLLNFWKPYTLPRITNCYDVHAYMPQHQYLAFFINIITVYTSLYYILKHKISKRNNICVCDGKHRPEHFLFIRMMASTDLSTFSLFIRQNFITKNLQPASILRSTCSSLLRK